MTLEKTCFVKPVELAARKSLQSYGTLPALLRKCISRKLYSTARTNLFVRKFVLVPEDDVSISTYAIRRRDDMEVAASFDTVNLRYDVFLEALLYLLSTCPRIAAGECRGKDD